MKVPFASLYFLLVVFDIIVDVGIADRALLAPIPGPDEPVMAGYDLVEYWNLGPLDDGKIGSIEFKQRHTNGYTYYFINDVNRQLFNADPEKYLPAYGGFCAWGIAWEYANNGGWPWDKFHMGPPCGPRDGWAILKGRLYCSIWRSYQDDFNENQEEGITLADKRWIGFYGSLDDGPQNNGCYAWNWQECFDRSIHTSVTSKSKGEGQDGVNDDNLPDGQSDDAAPLFDGGNNYTINWSPYQHIMGGSASWKFTLDEITSTTPTLIVELTATDIGMDEYVAFGVAPILMDGPLVACFQSNPDTNGTEVDSSCTVLVGNGMGTSALEIDPVQPKILHSSRNDSHYTIIFQSYLFGFMKNPRFPARTLFAKGFISGNGEPQPHINNGLNREAVEGIDFLSVVAGYDVDANRPKGADNPVAVLKELPAKEFWHSSTSMEDVLEILDGRVGIVWEVFRQNKSEILEVQLLNVLTTKPNTYIGFGIAENTMSGLVITCANPSSSVELTKSRLFNTDEGFPSCKQWRGFGTNLLPLNESDPGGWHLTFVTTNGTHSNYTIAGYAKDVVDQYQIEQENGNYRAICAIGRSAPDSLNPTQHQAGDREAFRFNGLVFDAYARSEPPEDESAGSTRFDKVGWLVYYFITATVSTGLRAAFCL